MKYVHWIEPGRLAIRPGPGWKPWDLDELRAARFQRIVSLDMKSPAVDPVAIADRGMEHIVVRLDDRPPRTPEIRAAYFAAIDQVLALLDSDGVTPKQTLVHCYAGCDRSPTIGICYLISRGTGPGDAIRTVRKMTGPFEYKECIPTIWEWHERRGRTRAT